MIRICVSNFYVHIYDDYQLTGKNAHFLETIRRTFFYK
jgi:hypothetical protein